MQGERIRDGGQSGGEWVVVTRGWGDWRTVPLRLSNLQGWHMAVEEGGDHRRPLLPRHMLGVFVPGSVLDAEIAAQGVEFGRDGQHGPGNAKVLVRSADNPRSVYRSCRAQGEKVWHSREYAERQRAKFAAKRPDDLARGEES
jgi:hypothetical protein